MNLQEWLPTEIQRDIWEQKYRYNNETLDEFFDRVSGGNSALRQLIVEKKFSFGGRVLAARGADTKTSYFNCYVIKTPEDNLDSIFETAKDMAKTYSRGGGCGIDISKLRPRGAKVNNAAKTSTGSVSFMELYDVVTGLISQNGRRGALMITLAIDNPDVLEFIDVKQENDKITNANISLKMSDEFFKAVRNNDMWQFRFETERGEVHTNTIQAKRLLRLIAEAAWDWGEPGMLFWDKVESWHLNSAHPNFVLEATNPCGEQPLPANGACNLGAINLSEFVSNPFTMKADIDYVGLAYAIDEGVKALDELIDEAKNRHAIDAQRVHTLKWRPIGLGIMGFAEMLIKMGIPYGSSQSRAVASHLSRMMLNRAARASALLAKERGVFLEFDPMHLSESEFYQRNFRPETKYLIGQHGLRNSSLLTIAPTGSISTMYGVSGGMEPPYAFEMYRKTESLNGGDTYYKVNAPIVEEYYETVMSKEAHQEMYGTDLPKCFVSAYDIDWRDRVELQGVWQQSIDTAISSTINLPESATIEDVMNIYIKAYEYGLKGVTIFRDNCSRVGILTTSGENAADKCPNCGGTIIKKDGCEGCEDCDWSKCSI